MSPPVAMSIGTWRVRSAAVMPVKRLMTADRHRRFDGPPGDVTQFGGVRDVPGCRVNRYAPGQRGQPGSVRFGHDLDERRAVSVARVDRIGCVQSAFPKERPEGEGDLVVERGVRSTAR